MTGRYFFSVILLICVATAAAQRICKYTLLTKTGIQAANATSGAQVDLYIGYSLENPHVISNICSRSPFSPAPECFRNDTLDAFFLFGPCDRYCQMALVFSGSDANSWNVERILLRASLTSTGCDFTKRFHVNTTLNGSDDTYKFDFCDEAGETKKQKLTEASRLRLFGKPSYTT